MLIVINFAAASLVASLLLERTSLDAVDVVSDRQALASLNSLRVCVRLFASFIGPSLGLESMAKCSNRGRGRKSKKLATRS